MKFLIYDGGRRVLRVYLGSLRSYPMAFMYLVVIAESLQLSSPVLVANEVGLILS